MKKEILFIAFSTPLMIRKLNPGFLLLFHRLGSWKKKQGESHPALVKTYVLSEIVNSLILQH